MLEKESFIDSNSSHSEVQIWGAGPAGLSASHELLNYGLRSHVLEASSAIGGLSRTETYKNFRFDIGGHRFYTRVALVENLWREILGPEFLVRPRLSRIYYDKRFFQYPLDPLDTLTGLGLWESARCLISYLWARLQPPRPERNLEDWLVARFGRRLYRKFFQTYTEKVWGIPCAEIEPEWAAQRIRGLSIASLIKETLRRQLGGKTRLKTLIEEFEYPRLGPGQMWEAVAESLTRNGSTVTCNAPVQAIHWEPGRILSVDTPAASYTANHFLSSLPIRDWIRMLRPAPPASVLAAADAFAYRDFLTVALILDEPELFPDNWLYIHCPSVKVGRIQNYKNWSPDMVPDPAQSCLGMEYFCFEGDGLWTASDAELIDLAARELDAIGIASRARVRDGVVIRAPKAYPVYNATYKQALATVREFLTQVPNLQLIGRNGMHHYNNQDHSMLTGIFAARNIAGFPAYDLWKVNVEQEYVESGHRPEPAEVQQLAGTQPSVPGRVRYP